MISPVRNSSALAQSRAPIAAGLQPYLSAMP